ncbi:MAG TPA: DUF421 domain-containing protein [Haloplasmataceae bacterium]
MLDNTYIQVTIELILGFISLLISVRIIGKRQMSQISPFDFISAIVLGELLGNAIYDKEVTIIEIIYALFLWTLLLFITEKLTLKFIAPRRFLQSAPSFIIYNGKFDYEKMGKEGLDFQEIIALLRQKDIFSVQDVDYCIFETSGNISVIKKNTSGNPILALPIIIEGKIIEDNLKYTQHSRDWVIKKLQEKQIINLNQILYAEWNNNDEIYIQEY